MTDSIFARASGAGRAGVAVIRLSGPASRASLFALGGAPAPRPRRLTKVTLRAPSTGEVLDEALAVLFAGPASFTGEDVVELHLHGGLAVVRDVLAVLADRPGMRPAEPGEFTRRAVLNGKMDLTQAEALADLVEAETALQRRQAQDQAAGALRTHYEAWRSQLIDSIAYQEAHLDFSEDITGPNTTRIAQDIEVIAHAITAHLEKARFGTLLRSGLEVALVGQPNAGKSTLLNALSEQDIAIVTDQPGTTRDILEVRFDLGGIPILLADMAGLRDSTDAIERIGWIEALARAARAALRLHLFPLGPGGAPETLDLLAPPGPDDLVLLTKRDLAPETPVPLSVRGLRVIAVSARTGAGLTDLLRVLTDRAAQAITVEEAAPTRERHVVALEVCKTALRRALEAPAPELRAEECRAAARALGRLTGAVDIEEVLDVVFAGFCIGK